MMDEDGYLAPGQPIPTLAQVATNWPVVNDGGGGSGQWPLDSDHSEKQDKRQKR